MSIEELLRELAIGAAPNARATVLAANLPDIAAGGALDELAVAHPALMAVAKGAFSRYPAVAGVGFHGGGADTRAFSLYALPGQLRQLGLYSAEELRGMVAGGSVTEAWAEQEALGALAAVVLVGTLVEGMDGRELTGKRFTELVRAGMATLSSAARTPRG